MLFPRPGMRETHRPRAGDPAVLTRSRRKSNGRACLAEGELTLGPHRRRNLACGGIKVGAFWERRGEEKRGEREEGWVDRRARALAPARAGGDRKGSEGIGRDRERLGEIGRDREEGGLAEEAGGVGLVVGPALALGVEV